jgi:hypothetical protein
MSPAMDMDDHDPSGDALNAFRGIVIGMSVSLALWAVIIIVIIWQFWQ